MGVRRKGREFALQMLFQIDMTRQDPQEVVSLFWQGRQVLDEARRHAEALFRGALEVRPRLDQVLTRASAHWKLRRMPAVDRTLLRLALYEMLFETDTPRVVAINEAIEIAKKYGSEDSSQFVNGVLDRVREAIVQVEAEGPLAPSALLDRLLEVLPPPAEDAP
jgi:N utilization substance protein B